MHWLIILSLIVSSNLNSFQTTPRKPLKIMIIDTGVNYNIPAIKPFIKLYGQTDAFDLNNHGTHLAGIIASRACSGVEIIPCYGAWFYKNSNKCFKLAMEIKVDIINYSMEGPIFEAEEFKLIKKLNRLGIKLIAAAGNQGQDLEFHPVYPACYPLKNITIVGALKANGALFPASNYKDGIAWELGEKVLSYNRKGRLIEMSGTSQATAIYTSKLVEKWCKNE